MIDDNGGLGRLRRLIDMYDGHHPGVLPVPIKHIARCQGWLICYRDDLPNMYGTAIIDGPRKTLLVNENISRRWQRAAIAHELAHVLARHEPSVGRSLRSDADVRLSVERHQAQEREAELLAARLLVPAWAIDEFETVDAIAAACDVPVDIVEVLLGSAEERAA